jgi:hypothetical protein
MKKILIRIPDDVNEKIQNVAINKSEFFRQMVVSRTN